MFHQNRAFQAFIVYISLLLDNILLTVIVPILPDYLSQLNSGISSVNSVIYKNFDLHYVPTILGKHPTTGSSSINFTITAGNDKEQLRSDEYFETGGVDDVVDGVIDRKSNFNDENSSIGILLAIKALIQLIVTPVVGNLTLRWGYRSLVVFGTFCLLIASLIFAIGNSYYSLMVARALQGVASACLGVCGMSLVAQLYPEEEKRSKVMGVILGSIALGVLLGYPFGGILYDFVGKSAPFYILSMLILADLVLQLLVLDLNDYKPETEIKPRSEKCCHLLANSTVLYIVIAIFVSTSAMAILEPCLPIWLIENLHPKKWQIGTVFIPDSIGYFIGTNFFGSITYKLGQIRTSVISLVVIGISCFLIPNAISVVWLMIPHFILGLGIGILDAALVPLLASVIDSKYTEEESTTGDTLSNYGSVYAVQQMSVSLAYSLTPIVGGEVIQYIGFRWLMSIVGCIQFMYAIILLMFLLKNISLQQGSNVNENKDTSILLKECQSNKDYNRFYNAVDNIP